METSYSRKQFLRQILRQGFRIPAKNVDLKESSPLHQGTQCFLAYLTIATDFSPELLHQDPLRLGLDSDSVRWEQLLQAVRKAMEEHYQTRGNDGSNPYLRCLRVSPAILHITRFHISSTAVS